MIPRHLNTSTPISQGAEIQEVFRSITTDSVRNAKIAEDILSAYHEGRHILVLTERTEHLAMLQGLLVETIQHLFVLHGRLPKKQRSALLIALEELPVNVPRVLLATGKLIGEGFDHPPLDTLVLAMPISWSGTLQQYAGRLHREHTNKTDGRVYDYVDTGYPMLLRMWDKRQRGYRMMGYQIENEADQRQPLKLL